MYLSALTWVVVGGVGVVVLAALRWEFTDLVLDRVGALADWIRGRPPERDAR